MADSRATALSSSIATREKRGDDFSSAATKEQTQPSAYAGMLLGDIVMKLLISALFLTLLVPCAANADSSDSPEIAACKATGILALKEKSPTVHDMVLDMDTAVIAKANTEIEGIAVRTVVMGDVYLEKKGIGKAQHFLCLIGDKGKVLLTFFAAP
jgi:hypothetical protein